MAAAAVESAGVPPQPEASPPQGQLRLTLGAAAFSRADGGAEDDFKTWALCTFLIDGSTKQSRFWHAEADNLGKTSVRSTYATDGFCYRELRY